MSEDTGFEVEVKDGVAHIKLNRAEKRNALGMGFWLGFPQTIKELDRSADVRVVVLSSTGPHFSAGIDIALLQDTTLLSTKTALERDSLRRTVEMLQDAVTCVETCRMPVIAAVQGGCMGAGLDLVCACDFRFVTEDAFFSIQEIAIGLMADLGTLQRLPKLLPEGMVREMAYTGSQLTAKRANELGFANEVFRSHDDMVDHALQCARRIAHHAPLAVSASKDAITFARDHGVPDSLRACAVLQAAIFSQEDVLESLKARGEKRTPEFSNLKPLRNGS